MFALTAKAKRRKGRAEKKRLRVDQHKQNAEAEKATRLQTFLNDKTPEEVFDMFDTDGSGGIDFEEFDAMLPQLGIILPPAKVIKYFKSADTSGDGEIDVDEFKMALFALDGDNSTGFQPSRLLGPADAFDMFDVDGGGELDEDEFALIMQYLGVTLTEAELERWFAKYDTSGDGNIDWNEFLDLWLDIIDPADELIKRGFQPGKYDSELKLRRQLKRMIQIEQEEEKEVIAEARRRRKYNIKARRKVDDENRTVELADTELANALDAGGQVYVFGTGQNDCMMAEHIPPKSIDGDLITRLWKSRVVAKRRKLDTSKAAKALEVAIAGSGSGAKGASSESESSSDEGEAESGSETIASHSGDSDSDASAEGKGEEDKAGNKSTGGGDGAVTKRSAFSRFTDKLFKKKKKEEEGEEEDEDDKNQESDPEDISIHSGMAPEGIVDYEKNKRGEWIVPEKEKPFGGRTVATNTAALWGRRIMDVQCTQTGAVAVDYRGNVFAWGGTSEWWDVPDPAHDFRDDDVSKAQRSQAQQLESKIKTDRRARMDARKKRVRRAKDPMKRSKSGSDASSMTGSEHSYEWHAVANVAGREMVTPRSGMLLTVDAVGMWEGETPEQAIERRARSQQAKDDHIADQIKAVAVYFNVWEAPSTNSDRLRFMKKLIIPKIPLRALKHALENRGDQKSLRDFAAKEDLVSRFAECLFVEERDLSERRCAVLRALDADYTKHWVRGDEMKCKWARAKFKRFYMRTLSKVVAYRRTAKDKDELDAHRRALQLEREYNIWRATRRRALLEGRTVAEENTDRGTHILVHVGGITQRGAPPRTPRGIERVFTIAAGHHHAAVVHRLAGLMTWGAGGHGRLGHGGRDDEPRPRVVAALEDTAITSGSLGRTHSAAICPDGRLFVWGSSASGQLGLNTEGETAFVSAKDGSLVPARLDDRGELYVAEPVELHLPGVKEVIQVSCGAAHTLALTSDNIVLGWGASDGGRLGIHAGRLSQSIVKPQVISSLLGKKVVHVSAGYSHSAVVTAQWKERLLWHGGHVYVTGSAWALGRKISRFERVRGEIKDVPCRRVECGFSHTAAVSCEGELYTWGRNEGGCLGLPDDDFIVHEPRLVDCLFTMPVDLTENAMCRQSSTYNRRHPEIALNGDTSGLGEARCSHTQAEEHSWWEMDIGARATIHRINVFNRENTDADRKFDPASWLFPFHIMISAVPFTDTVGAKSLEETMNLANAHEIFTVQKHETSWHVPAGVVGRYIRIMLSRKQQLCLAEVQAFGSWGEDPLPRPVSTVSCGKYTTVVVVEPDENRNFPAYYRRAIAADPYSAMILREFDAFVDSWDQFQFDYRPPRTMANLLSMYRDAYRARHPDEPDDPSLPGFGEDDAVTVTGWRPSTTKSASHVNETKRDALMEAAAPPGTVGDAPLVPAVETEAKVGDAQVLFIEHDRPPTAEKSEGKVSAGDAEGGDGKDEPSPKFVNLADIPELQLPHGDDIAVQARRIESKYMVTEEEGKGSSTHSGKSESKGVEDDASKDDDGSSDDDSSSRDADSDSSGNSTLPPWPTQEPFGIDIDAALETMDCAANPRYNDCPLCFPGLRCLVCAYHKKWVTRLVRHKFRQIKEFDPYTDSTMEIDAEITEAEAAAKAEAKANIEAAKKHDKKLRELYGDNIPQHMAEKLGAKAGIAVYKEESRKAKRLIHLQKKRKRIIANLLVQPDKPLKGLKVYNLAAMRRRGLGYGELEDTEFVPSSQLIEINRVPTLTEWLDEIYRYRMWNLRNIFELIKSSDPPPKPATDVQALMNFVGALPKLERYKEKWREWKMRMKARLSGRGGGDRPESRSSARPDSAGDLGAVKNISQMDLDALSEESEEDDMEAAAAEPVEVAKAVPPIALASPEEHAAAVRIQALGRGYVQRNGGFSMRRQKEKYAQAAATIQKVGRGNVVRRRIGDPKEATVRERTARMLIKSLGSGQVMAIWRERHPPSVIVDVACMVCVMLGVEPHWKTAKQLLRDKEFIPRAMNVRLVSLPLNARAEVARRIKSGWLLPKSLRERLPGVAILAHWGAALCSPWPIQDLDQTIRDCYGPIELVNGLPAGKQSVKVRGVADGDREKWQEKLNAMLVAEQPDITVLTLMETIATLIGEETSLKRLRSLARRPAFVHMMEAAIPWDVSPGKKKAAAALMKKTDIFARVRAKAKDVDPTLAVLAKWCMNFTFAAKTPRPERPTTSLMAHIEEVQAAEAMVAEAELAGDIARDAGELSDGGAEESKTDEK